MRLTLKHRIEASLAEVEEASLADDFQRRLTSLPNVHERKVLSVDRRDDGTVHRVVRYAFAGAIPAPVLRVIGGPTVSWEEEGTFHPIDHEWRFEIHPHVMQGRFECNGRYAFVADGPATDRLVEADIKVKVPLVGGRVERFIADGLKATMEAEARMLADYLRWKQEPAT